MENKEIKEKIQDDVKSALQNKDPLRVSVLRMMMAAIFNKEKEKRSKLSKTEEKIEILEEKSKLSDEEVLEVIYSEVKKRKDSIEQYQKGNRQDLVEKEEEELKILMEYLPKQMEEEEIRKIVKNKIQELGASSPQDMGKVIGAVVFQLKGKAEGGVISKIVREELS